MNKIVTFVVMLLMSFSILANDSSFRVVYERFDFYPPPNPEAVGFLGSSNDTLIIKYSRDPGKEIVGFSNENEMDTGGCSPEVFFEEVISLKEAECDSLALETFQDVFVDGRDSGVWSGNQYKFFYFVSDKISTVFFVPDDSKEKVLKVDSNFLTKDQLKRLLGNYLP